MEKTNSTEDDNLNFGVFKEICEKDAIKSIPYFDFANLPLVDPKPDNLFIPKYLVELGYDAGLFLPLKKIFQKKNCMTPDNEIVLFNKIDYVYHILDHHYMWFKHPNFLRVFNPEIEEHDSKCADTLFCNLVSQVRKN